MSIQIPSTLKHIQQVEDHILHLKKELKINDCLYGNMHLAVIEAVTNAIIHGNQMDESKTVILKCVPEQKTITFIIKDQGEGFDVDSIPNPTLPENREKLGGRGVFLIKYLADKVSFENNGALLKMTFQLT